MAMQDFGDNRAAHIFSLLCAAHSVETGALASRLNVSGRSATTSSRLTPSWRAAPPLRANRAVTPCTSTTPGGFRKYASGFWRATAPSTPPATGWTIFSDA